MTESVELLVLEAHGDLLRITARRHATAGQDEEWFDLAIEAVGHPFSGTVTDVVTTTDLASFRGVVKRLTAPGEVLLGGGRAAELRLGVEPQVGGEAGRWVVEATVTPHGDDPYPSLHWLLFDQRSFVDDVVQAIDELIGAS